MRQKENFTSYNLKGGDAAKTEHFKKYELYWKNNSIIVDGEDGLTYGDATPWLQPGTSKGDKMRDLDESMFGISRKIKEGGDFKTKDIPFPFKRRK